MLTLCCASCAGWTDQVDGLAEALRRVQWCRLPLGGAVQQSAHPLPAQVCDWVQGIDGEWEPLFSGEWQLVTSMPKGAVRGQGSLGEVSQGSNLALHVERLPAQTQQDHFLEKE